MKIGDSMIDKFKYCWQRDKNKYLSMGKATYFAIAIVLTVFIAIPAILRSVWPSFEHILSLISLYFLSTVFFTMTTITIYHIFMYFVYTKKYPFFEQYRSEPNMKWPWQENKQEWPMFFWRSIAINLRNALIIGGVATYIDSLSPIDIQMGSQDQPSIICMLWQNIVFLAIQEILFYIFHRSMHHPLLYRFHKLHHEYKVTACLAIMHASPLEHFLNIISFGLPFKLVARVYPVHIYTVIVWLTFRTIESLDGHCGYDWPWAVTNLLPFSAGGNYHSFHHSKNSGNYGAMLHLLDTLFGTNKDYIKNEPNKAICKETKVQ